MNVDKTFVEKIVYRLGGLWSKSCLKFETFLIIMKSKSMVNKCIWKNSPSACLQVLRLKVRTVPYSFNLFKVDPK